MSDEDRESFGEWLKRQRVQDSLVVDSTSGLGWFVWGVLGYALRVVLGVLFIYIPDSIRYALKGRQERQQLPKDSWLEKMTRCPHCPYLIPIDSKTCPHCEKPTGFVRLA